jgi:hypothetical protein
MTGVGTPRNETGKSEAFEPHEVSVFADMGAELCE